MLRGDVIKIRAAHSLAENPRGRWVTRRAVERFSLDRVFSRRTIPWKVLEKANRENPRILHLTHTKLLTYGTHVSCEGVNWEEEGF